MSLITFTTSDDSPAPLLDATEEPVDAAVSKRFHTYSLGLGLTVGAFIQLSTSGDSLSALNEDSEKQNSVDMILLLILDIVAVTSSMVAALIVLRLMRIIVLLALQCARGTRTATEEDAVFQRVIGVLVGVCICWITADLLLGTERHVTFTSITLILALMIWFLFGFFADSKEVTENRDLEEDHSFEEQRYSVQIV